MTTQINNVLDSTNIGRLLLTLSFPIFIGMATLTVFNVVDFIFIGKFVGSQALAGVSMVFPLQMLVLGIGTMVGVGGASLISMMIGAGNDRSAEKVLGNGITFSIFLSIALIAGILPTTDFLLRVMGASEEIFPFARDYVVIYLGSVVFNILSTAMLSFARSEGNARVVMIAFLSSSLLNIGLDALFIIPLNMGVRGAALAMVISQGFMLLYVLWYYASGDSYLKIHAGNLKPNLKILGSIVSIGIASFAQALASTIAISILIKMVSDYGGNVAISAFGIIQRLMSFIFMIGQVIGQGMQPVLGYNYGARRYHLASKAIFIASTASIACSLLFTIIVYLFTQPVISIFTSDPELVAEGVRTARLVYIVMPLAGFFAVGSMVFPSVGKPMETIVVSLARPTIFFFPPLFLLPRILGLNGVWLSLPVSDFLSVILTIALLIPLLKKLKTAEAGKNNLVPESLLK